MPTTFNFPNGIDNFQPVLINDITVVNADHVNDLRASLTAIENALVGITNIPYTGTSFLISSDNIKRALEKLDHLVFLLAQEVGLDGYGDDFDAYGSRIDSLYEQLDAHRTASGPFDRDGYTVHNVQGQVVGTLNQQALFNKTVDSGTWSVGPKFTARGGPGDSGNRMIEVYSATTPTLTAWIDEQGNASFNNLAIAGNTYELGTNIIQNSLIVDGYTIFGSASGALAGTPAFGTARTYAILGASAVTGSTGAGSTLTGNLGIYPGTSITNFPPSTYTGTQDVANAAASTAQASAQATYTDLSTRPVGITVSVLDSLILTPGTYTSASSMSLATSGNATLTLNGVGIYIFQIGSTLTTGAGGIPTITLTGGATAANVYWVVGSSATINSGSPGTFQGNVIAQASITVTAGGTVNGTLAALTGAVTLSATTAINVQALVFTAGTDFTIINGALTINGAITGIGDISLTGQNATFGNGTGTAAFNYDTSAFSGDLSVGGMLTVAGLSNLGDGYASSPLQISGNTAMMGNLTVMGDLTVNSEVTLGYSVSNPVSISASAFMATVGSGGSGTAQFTSSLYVSGDVTAQGTSFIFGTGTGTFFVDTMAAQIAGSLLVVGSTQLNSSLTVGTYPFNLQPVTISGTLTTYGAITFQSTLHVVGAAQFDSTGIFNGNLSTLGTLTASGATLLGSTLNVVDTVTIGGGFQNNTYIPANTDHGGITLDLNGNVSLDGKLTVKGPIDPISLEINMIPSVTDPFRISTTSGWPGPLTIATTIFNVDNTGNTTIGATPVLSGPGNLTVGGTATIQQNFHVNGTIITLGTGTGTATISVNAVTIAGSGTMTTIQGNLAVGTSPANTASFAGNVTIAGNLTITGGVINGIDFTGFNTAFNRHLLDQDPLTGLPTLVHAADHISFTNVSTGIVALNAANAIEELAGPGWTTSTFAPGTTPAAGSGTLVGHIGSLTAHNASKLSLTSSQFPAIATIEAALNAIVGPGGSLPSTAFSLYTITQALSSDFGHFADRTLDNLTVVAINTSLLPELANTIDLGSVALTWRNVYTSGTIFTGSIDVTSPQPLTIGASVGANAVTFGSASGSVLIPNNINVTNLATIGTVLTTTVNVPVAGPLSIGTNVGANTITVGGVTSTVAVPGQIKTNVIDVPAAGNMNIGASAGANNITIGGSSTNVVVPGVARLNALVLTMAGTAQIDVDVPKNLVIGGSVGANIITLGSATSTVVIPGLLAPAALAPSLNLSAIKTANYTLLTTDCVVRFNTTAAVTPVIATLPPSVTGNRGQMIIIKDVGGAINQTNKAINVQPSGSDTIDGGGPGAAVVLNFAPYSALTLVGNGAGGWMIC